MDTARALALLSLPATATRGDARRAYRRLAALTHPDVGGSAAAFHALGRAAEQLAAVLPPGAATLHTPPPRFAPRRGGDAPAMSPGGDYQLWSGADWTGAASGLSWTPTPPPTRRRRR